ncbi:MAG: hypothetical protein ACLFUN_04690 [Desulfobacterales bacterium]
MGTHHLILGQTTDFIKRTQPYGLTEDRKTKEKRILFAMEILTQKECDDYTCSNF